MKVSPGSVNVTPGYVKMTFDLRHPDDKALAAMANDIKEQALLIAQTSDSIKSQVQVKWTVDTISKAVVFASECVATVAEAAQATVGPDLTQNITSGAGHDS